MPVNQLHFVFHVYDEDSLKAETREGRGKGVCVSRRDSTPTYSDFKKFLRHNEN